MRMPTLPEPGLRPVARHVEGVVVGALIAVAIVLVLAVPRDPGVMVSRPLHWRTSRGNAHITW